MARRQKGDRYMSLTMEPALWKLLEKLQVVVNEQLRQEGRPGLSISGVASVVLKNALLENASDIQNEYQSMGLRSVAVQLTPLLGADGLAACGLPNGEGLARDPGRTTAD